MKKAALVTGAGSGIGAATAREFANHGYFIYLLGRDKEKLQETALHCKHGASIIGCDLKDAAMVQKKMHDILSTPVHQIEVLVNCAGTFQTHNTPSGSDEIWEEQFEIHIQGPVRLTRLLWPYFQDHGGGSIVNVSSTLGLRPTATTSSYSAMKAAMINWTQSLALEGASMKIRANCVCPGLVDTPIHSFHAHPPEEKLLKMGPLQPLGRIGNPEEVARAIYFLGGADSPWTTGAVLAVDGGINLG
jgi:NAD(P)-dependent dehydrogenase (short-subunit alcohol dehydrogenase family)